jgi:hypothetical protein
VFSGIKKITKYMGEWQLFVVETKREGVFGLNGVRDLGDVENAARDEMARWFGGGCWLLCFLAQTKLSRENFRHSCRHRWGDLRGGIPE